MIFIYRLGIRGSRSGLPNVWYSIRPRETNIHDDFLFEISSELQCHKARLHTAPGLWARDLGPCCHECMHGYQYLPQL